MDDHGLTIAILSFVALTISKAFALPMVKLVVKGWVWIYSGAAPKAARDRRRREIDAELHDEIQDFRAGGYHPAEIALHVLAVMVLGMRADIAWATYHVPNKMASKLERGSEVIKRFKTPPLVFVSVGLLALINLGFLASESDAFWREFLVANVGTISAILLVGCQKQTWARRIITWGPGVAMAMAFAFLLWMGIEHSWFTAPTFRQFAFLIGGAMAPLFTAAAVASDAFRVRLFNGRWWPVYATWLLIAIMSIATAALLESHVLLVTWSGFLIGLSGLVIATLMFCGGAALLCLGATKGTAAFMGWTAKSIRHLTG